MLNPSSDIPSSSSSSTPPKDSHMFQADVARLLHLMVHSIYAQQDIFLRELIANAADACEKLRYEALAQAELLSEGEPFEVVILVDKEAKTLSIHDNGIGMTREELIESLGTIAHSGTRAFVQNLSHPSDTADLIGQFGIGFYSAFMVADSVTVESCRAGTSEISQWSSNGEGTYQICSLSEKQTNLFTDSSPRGTSVFLHLKESAYQYLESREVERSVQIHASAIPIVVSLMDSSKAERRRLTEGKSLWTKDKKDILPEQYVDFYRNLTGQYDEPALSVHWRAEGRQEYVALAYLPSQRPLDLFDPARRSRCKLYVRHVLITEYADLLPAWLRFVVLLVDSQDLPLNVSRETIQASPIFPLLKKTLTQRILQELVKIAEQEPKKYQKIWDNFGSVLKEGLYESAEHKDILLKLVRFISSNHPEGSLTLAQYHAQLRPNQTALYYLTGEEIKRLASSPQLEGFRARDIDVLLLPDPVDPFWLPRLGEYEGKPFRSVTQGATDIQLIPLKENISAPSLPIGPEVATLLAFMQQVLQEYIQEVRASDRLQESPVCLVASDAGLDRGVERILAEHGHLKEISKPVLEVNASHPLVQDLAGRLQKSTDKKLLEDMVWLLLDEARAMDGYLPLDAAQFSGRLTRILQEALQL